MGARKTLQIIEGFVWIETILTGMFQEFNNTILQLGYKQSSVGCTLLEKDIIITGDPSKVFKIKDCVSLKNISLL